jgi:hypothetical protein
MDNNINGSGTTRDNDLETVAVDSAKSRNRIPKSETKRQPSSTVSRVVISTDANLGLEKLLEKVTDGFDGGQIERGDIVNWILINHDKLIGESEIRTIRSLHFDEMLAWNRLTKLANQEGGLSEDLKAQFKSLLSTASKKSKDAG